MFWTLFSLHGDLIAGQNSMAKNDESLKEQLTNVLTTIITSQNKSIEGQNTIKQELFIFTKFNKEKLEEVEKAVIDLSNPGLMNKKTETEVSTSDPVQRSSTPA